MHKGADPTLGEKVQTRDLVFRHSGTNGCLVFVIRRPGMWFLWKDNDFRLDYGRTDFST